MARGRNTITQRIALDGGKQFEAELKALGAVGEAAFRKLQAAAKDIKVDTSFTDKVKTSFQNTITAGERLGTSLGGLRERWGTLTDSVNTFVTRIGIATTAVGAAATGLGMMAKAAADSGGAINDAAQKTGLAVEKYQALQAAAEQAGVSQGAFDGAMARLNKSIAEFNSGPITGMQKGLSDTEKVLARQKEVFSDIGVTVQRFGKEFDEAAKKAAKGGKETAEGAMNAAEAYKELGISLDVLRRGKPDEVLLAVADALSKLEDGAKKTQIEMALFGRSGADLTAFFNAGSAGILAFENRLRSLGLILNQTEVGALDSLGDELDTLGLGFTRLRDQIVAALAPDLTKAATGLLEYISKNRDAIVEFTRYLGTEAIGIIKDFVAALSGDGQVQRPWVQEWTNNIKAFGETVRSVFDGIIKPAFNAFMAAAQKVAEAINAVFGTKLSGGDVAILALLAKVTGAFAVLRGGISVTIGVLTALWNTFKLARSFAGDVGGLRGEFTKLGTEAGKVRAGPLAALLGWPALAVTAFAGLYNLFPRFKQTADAAFGDIGKGWNNLVQQMSKGDLNGIWTDFVNAAKKTFANDLKDIEKLSDLIFLSAEERAAKAAKALEETQLTKPPAFVEQAMKDIDQLVVDAQTKWPELAQGLQNLAGDIRLGNFDNLDAKLRAELDKAKATAGQKAEEIKQVIESKEATIRVRDGVTGEFKEFKTKAETALKDIAATAGQLGAEAKQKFKKAASGDDLIEVDLGDGFYQTMSRAEAELQGFKDKIREIRIEMEKPLVLPEIISGGSGNNSLAGGSGGDTLNSPLVAIEQALTQSIARIRALMGDAQQAITDGKAAISGMGAALAAVPAAADAATPPAAGGAGPLAAVESDIRAAIERLRSLMAEAKTAVEQGLAGLAVPTIDWSALFAAAEEAIGQLRAAFDGLAQEIPATLGSITINWSGLLAGLNEAIQAILAAIRSIGTEAQTVAGTVASAASSMVQSWNDVAQAAREAAAAQASASSSGSGSDPGFAAGGYIRGPGTGTSDSIRAWLSNGEFVVRAAAVKKYGRQFLAALNAGRLQVPKFAQGGYVSAPKVKLGLPAFSAGGLVDGLSNAMAAMVPMPMGMPQMAAIGGGSSDLRPVNLTIGGETVAMQAAEPAIQQLAKIARHKRVSSGGTKPSWMR